MEDSYLSVRCALLGELARTHLLRLTYTCSSKVPLHPSLVLTDEEPRDPPLLHITYILVTIPSLPSSLLSYPHLNILAFIIHIVNTLSG